MTAPEPTTVAPATRPAPRPRPPSRSAGRGLAGLILLLIAGAGLVRSAAFLDYVKARLVSPFEAYHLESKMVHLAWRVQHGERFYPAWRDGPPYVSNFFGPCYFGLVGLVGRATGADIDGLFRIGRLVTLGSVLAGSLVLAVAAGRRYGAVAGGLAAVLSLGSGPMIGFAAMTRPDALADLLGLGGFLLALGRLRGATIAGGVLLVLAILTKQTAGVYLLAAAIALGLTGRVRSAAWLSLGAGGALTAIVGMVSLAIESEFVRGLLGESATAWSPVAWRAILWRFWAICPDLLAFSAIGLALWLRGPTRDIPLAVLTVVLLTTSVLTAGKKGADLNYFLGLRSVEALAVAAALAARRGARGIGAWALAGSLLLGLATLYPSLLHAAAQRENARVMEREHKPIADAMWRQYRGLFPLAEDPAIQLITDSGPLDIRQGSRALFGDPWLFRVLSEEGRIDVTPLVRRIEAEDFDRIVTTKDLDDPSYRTYEFGLPMPMVEAARRHTTPAGVQAGLFLYRPGGTPTP